MYMNCGDTIWTGGLCFVMISICFAIWYNHPTTASTVRFLTVLLIIAIEGMIPGFFLNILLELFWDASGEVPAKLFHSLWQLIAHSISSIEKSSKENALASGSLAGSWGISAAGCGLVVISTGAPYGFQ